MFKQLGSWLALHPRLTLTVLVIAALGPFLAKPFNIDDPLFIWLAQHVQHHLANPFGFDVNWYGKVTPMWTVTENPPVAGYYYALFGGLLGWSEFSLHLAGLVAALAVVLGTHRLAQSLCKSPLFAACVMLATPVFLVSANTVMCDVLMLAFWVWAVVFWVDGLKDDRGWKLALAGGFIALAMLTKYFGAALIPLLAVHGVLQKRKVGAWTMGLLVPLAALGAYQWLTHALYGHALFSDAASFVANAHGKLGFSKLDGFLIALSFTGGCIATATFLAPWLWRPRSLVLVFAVSALIGAGLVYSCGVLQKYSALDGSARIAVMIQFAFWIAAGAVVLALLADAWNARKDPQACLLGLWLAGTFLFAAFGNWTVNGRTILPMVPAVAILLARRWENLGRPGPTAVKLALAVSGAFAFMVAQADFELALAARQCAENVIAKYGQGGGTVWFEGHWGFQYYMEKAGARPVDYNNFTPASSDILILPLHNTYTSEPPANTVTSREVLSVPVSAGATTWQPELGAGFYSSVSGPLPFGFGRVPAESLYIYKLKHTGE